MIRQRNVAEELLARAADDLVSHDRARQERAVQSLSELDEGYWEAALRARLLAPLRRLSSPGPLLRAAVLSVAIAALLAGQAMGGPGAAFLAAALALAAVGALTGRRRDALTDRLAAVLGAADDPALLPIVLETAALTRPHRRAPLLALTGRHLPMYLADGRELPAPHRWILLRQVERVAARRAPLAPDSAEYALLMAAAVCLDVDSRRGVVPDISSIRALEGLFARLSPQGRLSVALANLLERLKSL